MTLQGLLHADEYGVTTSMLGGVGLTLSIWRESLGAGARSLFWAPKFVGLPRALVQAALRETSRHPGIHTVPQLQRTQRAHQRTWELFRTEEVTWMLQHADLVGGILMEPAARELWISWSDHINYTQTALFRARAATCTVAALQPAICAAADADVVRYERELAEGRAAEAAWNRVLSLTNPVSASMNVAEWWVETRQEQPMPALAVYRTSLTLLHDVRYTTDPRIVGYLDQCRVIASNITHPWLRRLVASLLTGELWNVCLEHIRLREGRVWELMMAAGVKDLMNAHERVFSAAVRVVPPTATTADMQRVHDWFGEMAGYAWWLGDDIPAIVRRCVGQEGGDCIRIGPTEIATLSAQMAERERIVDDWSRRIFIGMWNGLPAIGLLFVLEIVVLCMERRLPLPLTTSVPQIQEPRTIILQLQGPAGQVVAERQMIAAA